MGREPITSKYIEVRESQIHGTGVFARIKVPKGKKVIEYIGKKITKKGTDHSLESFRPLLDGTTDWPAVIEAFDETGYDGYLTF